MTHGPRGDRRSARRVPRVECAHAVVRLRPGGGVELVDLSASGTAIDGAPRLLPGAVVHLHLSTPGWQATVAAVVVRCEVSELSGESGARYRAGLRFDRVLEGAWPAAGFRKL